MATPNWMRIKPLLLGCGRRYRSGAIVNKYQINYGNNFGSSKTAQDTTSQSLYGQYILGRIPISTTPPMLKTSSLDTLPFAPILEPNLSQLPSAPKPRIG
jgi:hypothetical protein